MAARGGGAALIVWMLMFCLLPSAAAGATVRPGDFVVLSPPGSGNRLVALDGASFAVSEIASGGLLFGATDVAVGANGDILLTVPSTGIVRVDPATGTQTVFAALATLGGGEPAGITFGPGGSVYVSMQSTSPDVMELSSTGDLERVVTSGGFLQRPAGLTFGLDGALYLCETIPFPLSGGGGIVRVDPASGAQTAVAGGAPLIGPFHIAAAPDGSLWSAQFGSLSQRRSACVVRTRVSDGFSEVVSSFDCTAYGIAIRSDGTTVVGECMRINGDCGGSSALYTIQYPSGSRVWGLSGPVAVVPEGATPATTRTWGQLKVIYR